LRNFTGPFHLAYQSVFSNIKEKQAEKQMSEHRAINGFGLSESVHYLMGGNDDFNFNQNAKPEQEKASPYRFQTVTLFRTRQKSKKSRTRSIALPIKDL